MIQSLHPLERQTKTVDNPFAHSNTGRCYGKDDECQNSVICSATNCSKVCKESELPFRKRKMEHVQSNSDSECLSKSLEIPVIEDTRDTIMSSDEPTLRTANGSVEESDISNGNGALDSHGSRSVTPSSERELNGSDRRTSTDVHLGMERCSLDSQQSGVYGSEQCYGSPPSESAWTLPEEAEKISYSKLTFLCDEVDIEYLNDIHLNKQMCQVLGHFRNRNKGKPLSLLLVSSRLSMLAIQAKKMGYDSVIHATLDDHHRTLQQVAALNACNVGDITLIDLTYLRETSIKTDVIVWDVVEPCGAFKQQVLEDITYHR